MTNVPLPSFTDAGFSSPEELAVVAGVFADFNEAFGGNLNAGLYTPQGQLSMSLAAVIGAFNDYFANYVNQVDPAFSTGRMQDAIARIYFLNRIASTPTVVEATVSGATGTVLNVSSLAKSSDGTIFGSLSAVTIPASGSINVQFAALTDGPIAVPAGALNTIYRSVPGWDSITNATEGLPGQNRESAPDLEERRKLSVAKNAVGILPSVRGAVLEVDGVIDAYVTENNTAASVTVGGQTLGAHSLYVAVQGGTDADVARAIWSKKNPGCNYNGTTTVVVADTNGGYVTPPTYNVKFQRAAALAIDVTVDIVNATDVPSDAAAQIEAAVSAHFATIAKIGQTIYASTFVCPIGALGDWARVLAVEVNGAASQAVGIGQFPALDSVVTSLI